MGFQDTQIKRTKMVNHILDLEKKYFNIIESIFTSKPFIDDLLLIEKEIRENYPKFQTTWALTNKIKVPAERLVRHHLYTQIHEYIKGVYPSPISSDIGIKVEDAILCIDVKTIDTVGNEIDIKSTQVEKNQISFKNTNYKYIKTTSNLESIDHYSRLPVLTFVIKIIYTDDQYSFKLSRENHPSLVLACIPNGEISHLFDNNIIKNFKTYDYYNETDKSCYKAIQVPKSCTTSKMIKEFVQDYCVNERKFIQTTIKTDNIIKDAYLDVPNQVLWWQTSQNRETVIRAVKSGSTARLNNEMLQKRFDSNDSEWNGYKELPIPSPLL